MNCSRCKTKEFIAYSKERMQRNGDNIRKWANSENPRVARLCQDIIKASEAKVEDDDDEWNLVPFRMGPVIMPLPLQSSGRRRDTVIGIAIVVIIIIVWLAQLSPLYMK
jgi:hypothetical protein